MVFGIDLGTTNSLIGAGDELYTGLISSAVDLSINDTVPHDYYGDKIIQSYKTDMGLGSSNEIARMCSSVVLRKLAKIAERRTSEECKEVCVSVPAYFSSTQREAVSKSAEKAGLMVRRIINEPVAAAIAVCRNNKQFVCVYDLGGGTFDVTLIDAREGRYETVATDGMVLGGDDLDNALRTHVINKARIPIRKRKQEAMDKLRNEVRTAKRAIQQGSTVYDIDLAFMEVDAVYSLTSDDYKKIEFELFEPTITKTLNLINSYVPTYDRDSIKMIYTGGSTYCPFLQKYLHERIGIDEISYSAERDKLVAQGIAIVAKMVEDGNDEALITNVTKRLSLQLHSGAAYTVFSENTVIPAENRIIINNTQETDVVHIDIYQGNDIFVVNNEYIGTLEYNYGRTVLPSMGILTLKVSVSYDGIVDVSAFELALGEASLQRAQFKLNEVLKR